MKYMILVASLCLLLQACGLRMPDAPNAVPQASISIVQGV